MDNYQESHALEKVLEDKSGYPINIRFSYLESITEKFSDNQVIGSGGFGTVYKGKLRNGMIVAVKKLQNNIDRVKILENNFQREVDCLIKVKHKNIVRFLGYCSETRKVLAPYEDTHVWAEIPHRLFCFEYASKGSLHNYLTEASFRLQWRVWYQIIKGICEGLGCIHQNRIVHMDLKPQNILLDDGMVPKIADFGLSRRLSEEESKIITENRVGTLGYMAPEFIRSGIIKPEADIYSLGAIMIEILTGSREPPNVDEVIQSWGKTFETSESHPLLEQVKVCAEIGINCMDDNAMNRPAIKNIIRRLQDASSVAGTSSAGQLADEVKSVPFSSPPSQLKQSVMGRYGQHYLLAQKPCKPMRISASKMPGEATDEQSRPRLSGIDLDVHPLELWFPFEARKSIQCSLNLTNRTDRHVAYWMVPHLPDLFVPMEERILDPMSTVTLDVTMVQQEQPPPDMGLFEILMITMLSESDLKDLIPSIGRYLKQILEAKQIDGRELLNLVEDSGGKLYYAILTAATCPPRVDDQLSSAPKIEWMKKGSAMEVIDLHPTEPWILLGHGNELTIWDYEKQATKVVLNVMKKAGWLYSFPRNNSAGVLSVVFIPRMEWFVAGDSWGHIHVYSCQTMEEIKRRKVGGGRPVVSLAIHHVRPYLLAACMDGVIQIWDWEDWRYFRKVYLFFDNSTVFEVLVKSNPKAWQTFTSSDEYGGLKVWPLYGTSTQPISTIQQHNINDHVFRPYGHVFTDGDRNHVVVADDTDLKIWDLQTGTRVHSLCDTRRSSVTAVACHPTLPLIAAGIFFKHEIVEGTVRDSGPSVVRIWNSTKFRLEKTVTFTSGCSIRYIGFVDSTRLVIGTRDNNTLEGILQVLEIDMVSLLSQQ